jgi:hypothetical protein
MKLKEWGFMRHKPRKTAAERSISREASREDERDERDSSATVGPEAPVESEPPTAPQSLDRWQLLPDAEMAQAEPTFMGLLQRAPT